QFECHLLEYDWVFSTLGIPAALWRRTGEIYRANHRFATMVGLPLEMFREGRVCIYELMNEDSVVTYWEKYGGVAADPQQKAVMTACTLRNPGRGVGTEGGVPAPCSFSFTIRRDKFGIPLAVVGNFLPVRPPPLRPVQLPDWAMGRLGALGVGGKREGVGGDL